MRQLPEPFKEFLKLLTDHDVEYLLIGGWAVGVHGVGRPKDLADLDRLR